MAVSEGACYEQKCYGMGNGKGSHLCFSPDPAIVNGVYWSESLNKVFVDNFDRDPSLIWQYFGSAKGFFRQYPGECPCIENYNSSY